VTEVIVALALGSWVALAAVAGYIFVTHGWAEQRERTRVQQNLASAVSVLSSAIRLAGVCLPTVSTPVDARPLAGAHSDDESDTITVRMNRRCARATLTVSYSGKAVTEGATITVDTVQNFEPGMTAYIMAHPASGLPYGERFVITGVDESTSQLIVVPGSIAGTYLTTDHSRVFGLEEETFAVNRTGAVPVLTRATSTTSPLPVAESIDSVRMRYVLNQDGRQCVESTDPPDTYCIVALPGIDAEWALVRTVELTVSARSARPIRGAGGMFRLVTRTQVRPRNFRF
jgi:Tfp pilus assembly protein PilW